VVDPHAVRALLEGAAAASPVPAGARRDDAQPPSDGLARMLAAEGALAGPRDAVDAWAEANPERFAGLWFDRGDEPRSGPDLVVGVVAATAAELSRAAGELAGLIGDRPHGVGLRVVPRSRSETELVELQTRIEREQMAFGEVTGTHVTAVGVDPEAGRVEVCTSDHDEAFAEELRRRYGPDRVRVEQGLRLAPLLATAPASPAQPGDLCP
jgi:hypothetical protein